MKHIKDSILYIGVDDKTLDLFEGQYAIPNGISYNSYLILDEKVAVMDTVDARACDEWLEDLSNALNGRKPDYLVVSHMEPDHGGSVARLAEQYPEMKIVGNVKTFTMIGQFFDEDYTARTMAVKEGDTLSLGKHTLSFIMAPMIHWPEVMMSYESSEHILFSADAFGKFGALDVEEDWLDEARRYYFNIVGKYGAQVQGLLKKAAALDIKTICPLHGPVLTDDLGYYIAKYDIWSRYEPEDDGVLIAYASIHGHTAEAAKKLAEILLDKGAKNVAVADLARIEMSEAVECAFRYSRLVVAASSYDGGLFPFMEDFLRHLLAKTYRNRIVGIVENGTWAPSAGKCMRALLEEMKGLTICSPLVSIRSALKPETMAGLEQLAENILSNQ